MRGRVGAARVAGSCVLTVQQLVRRECDRSDGMQQLCAPLWPCCRQVANGAIIIPIRRMAIAARWKEPRNMDLAYHGSQFFR